MKVKSAKTPIAKRPMTMLVYGEPGVGKTLFSATAPKPLIVDLEHGIMSVVARKMDVDYIEADSIRDVGEILNQTKSGKLDQYQTIVIDSLTEAMKRLEDEYRKGTNRKITLQEWGFIIQRTEEMVRNFRDLPNHHVIFTALTSEKGDEDRMFKRPSISGRKLPETVTGHFDIVGYMYAWEKDGETARRIWVQPREHFYAKDRTGALPDVIQPDYTAMYATICKKLGWTGKKKVAKEKIVKEKSEAKK